MIYDFYLFGSYINKNKNEWLRPSYCRRCLKELKIKLLTHNYIVIFFLFNIDRRTLSIQWDSYLAKFTSIGILNIIR